MNMSGSDGILSVPSEHLPGLVALVLLFVLGGLALLLVRAFARVEVGWAMALDRRLRALSFTAKVALAGLAIGAVVHAAIVPTHWGDERTVAWLFVVDTIGFLVAAAWTIAQRPHWKVAAVVMLVGTASVYAFYLLAGWEDPDAVGLITSGLELAAGLALLIPVAATAGDAMKAGRRRWLTAAAVPVVFATLLATAAIADASSVGERDATPAASPPSGGQAMANMPGMGGSSSATSSKTLSLPTTSPAGASRGRCRWPRWEPACRWCRPTARPRPPRPSSGRRSAS